MLLGIEQFPKSDPDAAPSSDLKLLDFFKLEGTRIMKNEGIAIVL